MPAPRWLARVNRRVTNRLLDPLATRLPGFGVVVHTGRKTWCRYRTPVNVFPRADRYVIALTYGRDAQWVRNILAGGGCTLETRGRALRLTRPRLFHDARRRAVPAPVRLALSLANVSDFLELEPATDAGTPPLVLPLHALGRGDLAVAGGKGANLGGLVRAGLPVPDGFVVTTAAYDRFVAENRLGETIGLALHEQPGSGAAIRAAFHSAANPPEVEREILAAYDLLRAAPVAVRSSATAEDLPEAAFAGQQDTFLNVVGPETLLEAVRRCWASLWTDRAIAYRQRRRVDQQTVKLAVVVQRMVDADAAGVLFTANPSSVDAWGAPACSTRPRMCSTSSWTSWSGSTGRGRRPRRSSASCAPPRCSASNAAPRWRARR